MILVLFIILIKVWMTGNAFQAATASNSNLEEAKVKAFSLATVDVCCVCCVLPSENQNIRNKAMISQKSSDN